jgi:MoaD family protein
MKVQVRGYLTLRDAVGGQPARVVEAEHLTLRELMVQLERELGGEFAAMAGEPTAGAGAHPHIAILVNGRHHTHLPGGLDTPLADGDQVALFPPTAGG